MKGLILSWTFAVFAITHAYGDVTSCYICESQSDQNCIDPFDKTLGQTVNCKDFIDGVNRTHNIGGRSRAGPFSKAYSSEKLLPDLPTEYRCVKTMVSYSKDNTNELFRICVPVSPTIGSVCTYMKELANDFVVMKSCHECKTDNCNGSSYIALSLWSVLAFLLAKVF